MLLAKAKELWRLHSRYRRVGSPIIRKLDKRNPEGAAGPPDPLDHRVIAVFSAIFRVEAGSWARLHIDWLLS